jgi:DNA-binding transcriptional regulator GbsR (MarR family)
VSQRNLESRVKQIYREVNREHNAFQDRYDRETEHSKNFEKQAVWEAKVKRMLEETSAYGALSFSITLR